MSADEDEPTEWKWGSVHAFDRESPRVWPCLIHPARYQATYSGGLWHAWPFRETEMIPGGAYGSDVPCMKFWSEQEETGWPPVGKGSTPTEAHEDLVDALKEHGRVLSNEHDKASVTELKQSILTS